MIPGLESYKEKWKVESDHIIKPGLDSIQNALTKLGNPEKALKVVHLAGTNGKGSTLTFIEQMARAHSLTVGKFMSPCIIDLHDQIQINGENISGTELDDYFQTLRDVGLSGTLTDFELLTCVAFMHFHKQQVDLVLLEAGMGGREDSTNVIVPIVSVITSIALEHTKFLGSTIESIAGHKAGIIKQNMPVVVGDLPNQAMDVMKAEAYQKNAPILILNEHFEVIQNDGVEIYQNRRQQLEIPNLNRTLLGQHQQDNMALAITAFLEVAKVFHITINKQSIQQAVHQTSVPGRFEEVFPNVFFDGAHNPASIQALAKLIQQRYCGKNIEIILGMLADKDVKTALKILEPIAFKLYFIDIPNDRALNAEKFYALSKHPNKEILIDEIELLKQAVPPNTVRIVTGSLYLLASIREKLNDGE